VTNGRFRAGLTRCALILILIGASTSWGGVIMTRPELNAFMVGASTNKTEDLEKFNANPSTVYAFSSVIDALTVAFSQGPGLVLSDLRFRSTPNSNLQWNGRGQFSDLSRTILSNATGNGIAVDFLTPVNTFGLDLDMHSTASPATVNVTFFNSNRTAAIGTVNGLAVSAAGAFIGFQDMGGIGGVQIARARGTNAFSVDNVTFGVAVPEPATIGALALTALLARLRRGPRRRPSHA
jgi:hypothetical protein